MTQKILLLFGTHGNEIPLMDSLKYVDERHSTLFDAVVVNKSACDQKIRCIKHDMNRTSPGDIYSEDYELKRWAEIIVLSKQYNLVIDVHGTNSDSGIFALVTKWSVQNIISALQYTRDIPVVLWQTMLNNWVWPITQFVDNGFELECGPQDDFDMAKQLWDTLNSLFQLYSSSQWKIDPDTLDKFVHVVVWKVDGKHTFEKDFVESELWWDLYYPILTNNQYGNTWGYICKKIAFKSLIMDLGYRISPTSDYLLF